MKKIKLIATDLDGTLFNDNKQISDENLKAIEDACAMGLFVVPATGRALYTIPQNVLELNCINYAITSNGADVIDLKTGKSIYKNQLDAKTALGVINAGLDMDIMVEIFVNGKAYTLKKFADKLVYYGVNPKFTDWIMETRNIIESFSDILSKGNTVENINLIFTDLNKRKEMYKYLTENLDVEVTNSLGYNLEAGKKGCSKGDALEKLAEFLGINMKDTMCLGDNENDRDMLSRAGISVAMSNGEGSIKSAVTYISNSNNDNGFAEAVYKFAVLKKGEVKWAL